jgi:hypothetical protein
MQSANIKKKNKNITALCLQSGGPKAKKKTKKTKKNKHVNSVQSEDSFPLETE